MVTRHTLIRVYTLWVLSLFLLGIFAGCQGGNSDPSFVQPPAPVQTNFATNTPNYYYHYNEGQGYPPFQASWQFANANYPIPVSYQVKTSTSVGLDVAAESESAISCWNRADARVCILSRTTADKARIHVILEDDITYNGQTNIIGLTTVGSSNTPSFQVEIATRWNTNSDPSVPPVYQALSVTDIKKTIAHELGHTLGLGHSPNQHDLMYFQANDSQGTTYSDFLTYGDAMAVWTTLNARSISWQHLPVVTLAPGAPLTIQPTMDVKSTQPRGAVVDVYIKQ